MKKLELLFEEEQNQLSRCLYCGTLYTASQQEWMVCPKAKVFIDFHGSVIAKHAGDRNFDINKFVMHLR